MKSNLIARAPVIDVAASVDVASAVVACGGSGTRAAAPRIEPASDPSKG